MGWAQIYPGVVFFGAKFNETAIGLGGSMNNLLGFRWNIADVTMGVSHTPWLVSLISKEVEMLIPFDPVNTLYGIVDGSVYDTKHGGNDEYEKRIESATFSWANDIAKYPSKYQVNRFEFVAKMLRYTKNSPFDNNNILLGTPIYVALDN